MHSSPSAAQSCLPFPFFLDMQPLMHVLPPGYPSVCQPPPHCLAAPALGQPAIPGADPPGFAAPPGPPLPPPIHRLSLLQQDPQAGAWELPEGLQQLPPMPAADLQGHPGAISCLPDRLADHNGRPASPKLLIPTATTFCQDQQGLPTQAAGPEAPAPQAAGPARVQGPMAAAPSVAMPPVVSPSRLWDVNCR